MLPPQMAFARRAAPEYQLAKTGAAFQEPVRKAVDTAPCPFLCPCTAMF